MSPVLFTAILAISLGPAGSGPAREPQLAASGSFVGLTFGAGGAIYFSASHDAGKSFSAPVKVSESPILPLNRHRGPRIALTRGAVVITAVAGRTPSHEQHAHGLPSDGDLTAWRSTDEGKTWSKGSIVNDVPGAPTEGLHGLAADSKGTLFAAWLDKRSGSGTQLYGALSADAGRTWSTNVRIYASPDGTICECCHPSVAIDSGGRIVVMWRNWLNGSRDMYVARSVNGSAFSSPEKLGTGTWKLNACTMDGGGLAISQGRIVTAWRRDHSIYFASPGEPEKEIGEGIDVGVSSNSQGVYAIWTTPDGVRVRKPDGAAISVSAKGSFPAIVALAGGGALAAWEDDGRIGLERIP